MRLKKYLRALMEDFKTPLELLPLNQLVDVLENFNSFLVRENPRGEFLNIGFDLDGKFYATRNLDSASEDRIYTLSGFGNTSTVNQFKAVFAACQYKARELYKLMGHGTAVQIAFEFNQGTAYDLKLVNHIKFVKSVHGIRSDLEPDQTLVERLNEALRASPSTVTVPLIIGDGSHTKTNNITTTFHFSSAKRIQLSKKFLDGKVSKFLAYLKEVPTHQVSELAGKNNYEIATYPMSSIKVAERGRAEVIKQKIINTINTEYRPWLIKLAMERNDHGLLLIHPSGEKTVELAHDEVDDELKAFANSWLHRIRGVIKSTDDGEDPIARGGIYGEFMITAATVLGEKDLALKSKFNKITADFSDIPVGIAESCEYSLNELQQSLTGHVMRCLASLDNLKMQFDTADKYIDVGNTRVVMRDSDLAEIMNLFSEVFDRFRSTLDVIKNSNSTSELVEYIFSDYLAERT